MNGANTVAVAVAELLRRRGRLEDAAEILDQAIKACEPAKNVAGAADVYYQAGHLFSKDKANQHKAMEYFRQAASMYELLGRIAEANRARSWALLFSMKLE
jgi:tetratricopeptide (TPR) repeat protein